MMDTYTTYYHRPDESLEMPQHADAAPGEDLPALDLTSTARRLLGAIRASGLPWDLTVAERSSGGPAVDLRVHHLTGRWSITRWAWHRRRITFQPHMSPAAAHRRLPAAIADDRREYRCGTCQGWSRWTRGRTHQGTSPDCELWWTTGRALPRARVARVIVCPRCDTAAVVDDCQTREGVDQ